MGLAQTYVLPAVDPQSLITSLAPQLLSPSNVAVYGGLCALATFDRQELQRNVISSRWVEGGVLGRTALLLCPWLPPGQWVGRASSEESGICSSFKLFLELEPQVRDIIFKFYESKYASCLKMLDEMKVRGLAWLEGRASSEGLGQAVPDWLSLPGQLAARHVPGSPRQDPVHTDSQPGPHSGKYSGGGRGRALWRRL